GLGRVYAVTERSMVPDPSLTIRERAIAAWPSAWQGQNLRDIVTTLGIDIDVPWRELPKKTRDWLLFTAEQPQVPVYTGSTIAEARQAIKRKRQPDYLGTFTGARKYVLDTFAKTQSALMKRRVAAFMEGAACPTCHGKRVKRESLAVTYEGLDIAELSRLPIEETAELLRSSASGTSASVRDLEQQHDGRSIVAQRIAEDLLSRMSVMLDLGLGYLSLDRSTPTRSPGELQRLRLATQVKSNLFGVVYVLDEPSAGLHPADTGALLEALEKLKASGNSLFVVEHDLDVVRRADWIVDVGPGAGQHGGRVLYSGPPAGLAAVEDSATRRFLFGEAAAPPRSTRKPSEWLRLAGVSRNNVSKLDVAFPLGVLTTVTGVSGSGKSSVVSQALVELVSNALGHRAADADEPGESLDATTPVETSGRVVSGMERIKRLVRVDQRPIGRTPRSNLATYTGLFDGVRALFAATKMAKARRYDAGRFSFNVAKGRCPHCEGEGFVCVELLFLPSVYAPCPTCHGARYNPATLEITYRGRNIADVLRMTVHEAREFFAEERSIAGSLTVLYEVGLGYLRLGQPATELSGGEAQRIKLATELQRTSRGATLYVLDEPTTGLHPADVEGLIAHLHGLVEAGNTMIVVEHDINVIMASDWGIDIGPGAGGAGGQIVAQGAPLEVAGCERSRTAPFLAAELQRHSEQGRVL
ncbi:MAG: excinuclease ABC subunit UvrA, partial [Gemmatimonadaceae bacterium]